MRKRIRRRDLADAFKVNIRTVDDWAKRGVISPPHYLEGSVIPYWYEDEIDRRATVTANQSNRSARSE